MIIKAGIDFGDIERSVRDTTITVQLPQPRILSSEIDLDSFEPDPESERMFQQISPAENNDALKGLQKDAEETAVANGLLDDARRNAELILTGFFAGAYDLTAYQIRFTNQ